MAQQIDLNLKKQVGRYNVSYTLVFGNKILKTTTGVYADSVDEARQKLIALLEATTKFEITKVKRLPRDLDFSTKRKDQKKILDEYIEKDTVIKHKNKFVQFLKKFPWL